MHIFMGILWYIAWHTIDTHTAGSKTAVEEYKWGWIALNGVPVMYLFLLLVIVIYSLIILISLYIYFFFCLEL